MSPYLNKNRAALDFLGQAPALPPLATLAISVAVVATKWTQNRRTRLKLARLTDDQLRDIGITRDQANEESRRPFWE